MKEILQLLNQIIDTKGLNAKKDLLRPHITNNELIAALNLAYNPYILTGIAKKKLQKDVAAVSSLPKQDGRKGLLGARPKIEEEEALITSFKGFIDYFANHHTGTDRMVQHIQTSIKHLIKDNQLSYPEYYVLEQIITKDLTLGINVKSINEVMADILPTFNVMLGSKYEEGKDKLVGRDIAITEKLDGNRCLTFVENGVVTFYSRNGKEIEGLEEIESVMKQLPDGIYDGELMSSGFNETQSTIRTKGTKEGLVYHIFDYLSSIKEYRETTGKEVGVNYLDRHWQLRDIFINGAFSFITLVEPMYMGRFDEEEVIKCHNKIKEQGGEGVMINTLDAKYVRDRTKELLKVKTMKTCDLKCIGVENGEGRLANTLGFIICEYKDNIVKVGSGFTDMLRDFYYNNQNEIVNKIVEIQYFEETTNQDGTLSLRFPVFLKVREDKDEVSYE